MSAAWQVGADTNARGGDALPDWPLYGWADDVRPAMAAARDAGEPFALITLLRAEGGAPRPPGTQMLVSAGRLSGFLSGGCVEGDVVVHAFEALANWEPQTLIYGDGSPYPDIRLLCGGSIELLIEPIAPNDPTIAALINARERRAAITYLTDGRHRAASQDGNPIQAEGPVFHVKHRYDPPTHLIVVGGDPTALAIAALGAAASFRTTLVRPKGPAEAPPLAGVSYQRGPAADALSSLGLDPWTAVAVATHDMDTDEEALSTALASSAFYVGVLGARRRLPERIARLRARGASDESLSRLRGPIGLDLGGKAPFEIATAVLAEVIAARHAASTAPLSIAVAG